MNKIKIYKGLCTLAILASLTLVDGQSVKASNEKFIDHIAVDATKIAQENDLYASVMIAQAVLESNFGKSQLSQSPFNNYFGIKDQYNGKTMQFKTLEDQGSGQLYSIKSSFRKYPTVTDSFVDYANLLKEGLKNNPFYYMNTWKSNAQSYMDATSALQGAYATDSNYARKLNHIIEKYDLTQFDVVIKEVASKFVIVKKGDTLSSIAKEVGVSTDQLFLWNELDSNDIQSGSKLVVAVKKKRVDAANEAIEVIRSQTKKMNKYNDKKKRITHIQKPVMKEMKNSKTSIVGNPVGKKIYIVKNGDSIRSISKKFNVQEEVIVSMNKLSSTLVYEGQRLIIQ